MARTRFPADAGLTSRMALVMFLLGALFVAVFVGVLVYAQSVVLALLIGGGLLAAQYFGSDKIAMASMRAREVSAEQAPKLHGIIDRLCALADMPKPRVAMADTPIPNAFATGRNEQHAVVCVTTGLMQRLDESEVESVLAHELSHIAHRDVMVMTIAGFLGMVAGLVLRFAYYSSLFGGGRRRDDQGVPVVLVVMVGSVIVYAISFLLTRALSRYRELSADRAAAVLTGRPSTLASALTKVSGQMASIPTRDLRSAEPVSSLLFAPALSRKAKGGPSLSAIFSTHPPLEQRLDQLARIEADMGRSA
ncbi:MAG TPA: zinc metalloprotease HtpX [Euzebyales bacterium]|nr:zinc metalloprotease HtpX [Euzebyales bacterium]